MAGRIYRNTTNAVISEGIGNVIAMETGRRLGNMEAVQFHPTAILPGRHPRDRGCRGDGGLLKDVDGHRFMPDYEPEKKELLRATSCRGAWKSTSKRARRAARAGEHLWLDITAGRAPHQHNLREVWEICHYFLGVDPVREMIPVRPAQHYTMGGVRTQPTQSPTLKGLSLRARQATCTGFNRLGATRWPRQLWPA